MILLLAVLFYSNSNKTKFNWRETYRSDQEQPYGTSVVLSLLKSMHSDYQLTESKGPLHAMEAIEGPLSYVAVGEEIYYSEEDVQKLLELVEHGDNAMIVSKYLPYDLLYEVMDESCLDHLYYSYWGDGAQLNFEDTLLRSDEDYGYNYQVKDEYLSYEWIYMDSLVCDSTIITLGHNQDSMATFVQVPYGDGNIYLNTVPLALSNINLLDFDKIPYLEKVFSYLPASNIYWDEHSKISYGDDSLADSPLQYILSQKALKWAWYLLLALVVLYMFSYTRRRQKVIPVLESVDNTSIEFTETIGALYYQQQNHRKLGLLKMRLFLEYIRNRYHINTSLDPELLIKKIITMSEVSTKLVERIFSMHQRMEETSDVSDYLLIEFNGALETFYENCK